MEKEIKNPMWFLNPDTLAHLYHKHYNYIHYSFDVAFYEDKYIGYLRSIKMDGYEFKLESKDLIGLIKKADKALELMSNSRIDKKAMDRIKDVAIIEKEMALTH